MNFNVHLDKDSLCHNRALQLALHILTVFPVSRSWSKANAADYLHRTLSLGVSLGYIHNTGCSNTCNEMVLNALSKQNCIVLP